MITDSATFSLPPVMTLEDCENLQAFFETATDQSVSLDCSAVTRLNGLTAQMIQMASGVWARNDMPFTLKDPSPDFRQNLATLGFDSLLSEEEAA
ncbi:STAS domain-containing protein [Loktanella agnita]|uniref:STAS domain-containing protein n=1 Tax=Loktanella agnita TaxID=287097 RepID=UPI00398794C6